MSEIIDKLELSVVIPAYNEEKRLPSTLESVHGYLTETGRRFEIIVVNDGSSDGTRALVEEFGTHFDHVRLITYEQNKGKGHAVRVGMRAANGAKVLFNDADGASPIEEVIKLEKAIANGASVAIGSRALPDETRKVAALAHRKIIGNSFNTIVKTLVLDGIYDTQCGFKMFTKEAAEEIFAVAKEDGFAFDVELLYIAKVRGYKTTEVAINWHNVEGSKINVVVDSMKMFAELVRISLRSRMGVYKASDSPPPKQILKVISNDTGSCTNDSCEHTHH